MRFKLLFPFLLLCNSALLLAQQHSYHQQDNFLKANSVWVVTGANIDFNPNTPLVTPNDSSRRDFYEGCASVAHPVTGELLFYSNGRLCRNRNNQIMPNGVGLYGSLGSTTQGVCIVPVIDDPDKFYLFSLYGPTDGNSFPGGGSLFYSVIDMKLDNNLGDVVSGQKNIILDTDTLSESMIAIPGDNCDIWLIVHDHANPVFKAYHITKDGIDPNPVISTTGGQLAGKFGLVPYMLGGMAVSPNRKRIAISGFVPFCQFGHMDSLSGVLLSKFDPATGVVSDAIQVEKDLQTYTCIFSPDNSKLYVSNYNFLNDSMYLQQYDISNFDTAAINGSKQLITTIGNSIPYFKLYKDVIYFRETFDTGHVLSSINKPNLSGALCEYLAATLPLLGFAANSIPLPNDVVYPLYPDTVYTLALDTLTCEPIRLRPLLIGEGYEYTWNDGSSDTVFTIPNSGTYWVSYNNGCHYKVDTFIVKDAEMIPPIINVNVFELSTTVSYSTYQWMLNGSIIPGATNRTYNVTENGNYQVIVTNEHCIDTSDIYRVTNYTSIHPLKSIAEKVYIYPNPTSDMIFIDAPVQVDAAVYGLEGRMIKNAKDFRKVSVQELPAGIYFIHITTQDGTLIKVEKLIKLKSF